MFGEHISNSQILQESERHINIKEFDADFLEIFQNNMEDKNTEYDLDNDNSTFLITESAFNTNLNFGNIVARAQKRNAALNTNKRQNLTNEKKTIVLMAENLGEQIVQDKIEESVPTIIKLREGNRKQQHFIWYFLDYSEVN